MKNGEKIGIRHRTDRGAFNGAFRTGPEVRRRKALAMSEEHIDIAHAQSSAVYLKPPESREAQRARYLSEEVRKLKFLVPMFTGQ